VVVSVRIPVTECDQCGREVLGAICPACHMDEVEAEELRVMVLVRGEKPHDCGDWRFPDGDCRICWLASK
jgi:hypothetical protein